MRFSNALLFIIIHRPDGVDGKPGRLRTGKMVLPYRFQPWHAQTVRHGGRYGSGKINCNGRLSNPPLSIALSVSRGDRGGVKGRSRPLRFIIVFARIDFIVWFFCRRRVALDQVISDLRFPHFGYCGQYVPEAGKLCLNFPIFSLVKYSHGQSLQEL